MVIQNHEVIQKELVFLSHKRGNLKVTRKTKPAEKKKDFDEEDTFIATTARVGFTITGKMIYDGADRAYSKLRLKKALIEKKKHILKNPQKVPLYRIESPEDWQEFDEKVSLLKKTSPPPALIHFGEEKSNS